MTALLYASDWFASAVTEHDKVRKAKVLANGQVQVKRTDQLEPLTVAPLRNDPIDIPIVKEVLAAGTPSIILLVPKRGHYDWDARKLAERSGSSILTVRELYTFLGEDDPRPLVDKNVDYARRVLSRHDKVLQLDMLCESSFRLKRTAPLRPLVVAVEYEYEFSEESVVRALERHPSCDVILNSNPNGRPTSAALALAAQTKTPIFLLKHLMGALNYDGTSFRDYQPRKGD